MRSCLINLSLSTGRCQRILRLLRCGRYWKHWMLTVSNFPTSARCSIWSFFQKSVFVQLNNYLTVNGLHERFQSANKAHHSTETALLTITNDILLSLDKGDNVFLLLLHLPAAFDSVNHSLLLSSRENSFGITGTVLQWFHSYLFGRSQFVEINDTKSSVRDLTVGVPQGSGLGPIFYLLYTAPLAEIIRSHGLYYHFYADDTQLYISFKDCDVDVARLRVENCVADICHWMDVNELKLDHDKT